MIKLPIALAAALLAIGVATTAQAADHDMPQKDAPPHAAVAECCTIGVPDPKRGETVKSFIVLKEGAQVDADSLIAHCRENLAAYKVPRLIEFRDTLPKSTLLKLLRRVLLDEELEKIKRAESPASRRSGKKA